MDWKALLASVAPTLGTALLGPLGGLAVSAIGDALGMDKASEKDLSARLAGATPDDLLKIKQADQDFEKHMADLGVDLEKVAAGDRDSARKRQMEVKDRTPAVLAGFVTLGFFAILAYMLVKGLPASGNEALLVMLGALGTAFGSVIAYYYGSSVGSARKDAVIAGK